MLKKITNKVFLSHVLVWSLYTLYYGSLLRYFYNYPLSIAFLGQMLFHKIGDVILFYVNSYWVFRKFFSFKKLHFLLVSFSLVLSCYVLYFYVNDFYVFPFLNITLPDDKPIFNQVIAQGFVEASNFTIFSLGYYFALRVIQQQKEIAQKEIEIANQKAVVAEQKFELAKKEKELAEEREKNAILAKEKAQAEMAFLRAQINPHFLFNTLNLIYGKIITSTKEVAADMMLEFSDMMQYATSTKMQEDTVDLNGEIGFVKKYLNMYKARNQQNAHIDYEEEGYFGSDRVVPMVLITIIENALKHGLVDDPANPLFIRVSLEDNFFVFMVRNLKNPYPHDVSGKGNTGVGIVNIIKRLNAVYQNGGFTLESEDLGEDYVVTFTVDYNLIKLKK
jgi:two-component system, LytTR family, sensor kinase